MLEWLAIEGVRNLATQRVDLSGPLVVVSGANAQGKSSLLESAYLLATTRSFRATDPRDAITHGAPLLRLEGLAAGPSGPGPELGMALGRKRGERLLSVGKSDAKLAEYLGLLPTLALAGESLGSLSGSPAERRRFVDRATAAADPGHLGALGEYRRALAQRNRLVKDGAPDRQLDPWDELLGRQGDAVTQRRRAQMAAWQAELGAWPELFPEGAQARLGYREAGNRGDAAEGLGARLVRSRERDRNAGQTTVGPHRDDFGVEVGGVDLLRFGSAGQVRSALSALTLAQARQVRRSRSGLAPLLVLDDVDTDLDPDRLNALLLGAAAEGQVLAASSKPGLDLPGGALRLTAAAGEVRAAGPRARTVIS